MKKMSAALLIAVILAAAAPFAYSADLKDILKDAAIAVGGGYLVKTLAPQLNDFINTITFNRGVKFEGFTKVVPIVSAGEGFKIGAAQVGGNTRSAVDRTKAVAQLEGQFKRIGAKALIPIDSENPLKQFRRVPGVGVTAIIDVKL